MISLVVFDLRFGEMYLMKGIFCSIGMAIAGSDMRTAGIDVNCLLIVPKDWMLLKFPNVVGFLNCTITSTIAYGFEVGRSGAVLLLVPA